MDGFGILWFFTFPVLTVPCMFVCGHVCLPFFRRTFGVSVPVLRHLHPRKRPAAGHHALFPDEAVPRSVCPSVRLYVYPSVHDLSIVYQSVAVREKVHEWR